MDSVGVSEGFSRHQHPRILILYGCHRVFRDPKCIATREKLVGLAQNKDRDAPRT